MATKSNRGKKRLLVIGLDGAEPGAVFGPLMPVMPNLTSICQKGVFGPLQSTDPPVTIPSWVSMFTGKDPGQLGLYGFRIRRDRTYGGLAPTTSRDVRSPRVWDTLSSLGLECLLLGIPGTYPPWPLRGKMVSGPLTPDRRSTLVWPGYYRDELDLLAGRGGYAPDVEDYRTQDKSQLIGRIKDVSNRRFKVAKSWAAQADWDLMVMVEMGTDRIHHGFWRFFDPTHPGYQRHSQFTSVIPDYYSMIDRQLGQLLALAGPSTSLLVVSDHGSMPMHGSVAVNQWLIEQGDLVLRLKPETPRALSPEMVDWEKTKAWADGGFYARIWINLQDREPLGKIQRKDYDSYRRDLAERFSKMEIGSTLPSNKVIFPDLEYSQLRGLAPDLMVYFGDLALRATAQVGLSSVFGDSNDTGPDDANHSKNGIFVFWDPSMKKESLPKPASVTDIHSLILRYFVEHI